jgi:uncharacterized MnhB-related membrane protein
MAYLEILLLGFLIICALAATLVRSPMVTTITLMAYSVIMSVVWMLLQAPDLAITEAAVGAGVDTILFFVVMKKVKELHRTKEEEKEEEL